MENTQTHIRYDIAVKNDGDTTVGDLWFHMESRDWQSLPGASHDWTETLADIKTGVEADAGKRCKLEIPKGWEVGDPLQIKSDETVVNIDFIPRVADESGRACTVI